MSVRFIGNYMLDETWHSPEWGGHPVTAGYVDLTDQRGVSTEVGADIEYAVRGPRGWIKHWTADIWDCIPAARRNPDAVLLARAVTPAWEVPA